MLLLSNYEDSLKEIEKSEHYIRILIWIQENNIKEKYEDSLNFLKTIWEERNKNMNNLKKNDFEKTKNSINFDFLYKEDEKMFFINLLLPNYPCEFENILNNLQNEEIFIMNFCLFYIINDMVYANYEKRNQLEELRKNFTNVFIYIILTFSFIYYLIYVLL